MFSNVTQHFTLATEHIDGGGRQGNKVGGGNGGIEILEGSGPIGIGTRGDSKKSNVNGRNNGNSNRNTTQVIS